VERSWKDYPKKAPATSRRRAGKNGFRCRRRVRKDSRKVSSGKGTFMHQGLGALSFLAPEKRPFWKVWTRKSTIHRPRGDDRETRGGVSNRRRIDLRHSPRRGRSGRKGKAQSDKGRENLKKKNSSSGKSPLDKGSPQCQETKFSRRPVSKKVNL